jgi:hypothetical protein
MFNISPPYKIGQTKIIKLIAIKCPNYTVCKGSCPGHIRENNVCIIWSEKR